jgi:hypothetical protein
MRGANHNFIFTTNSLNADSKGNYSIYIQYKFKKFKKSKVTPIKIPEQSWDKNNNWIKGSHEKKLEIEREALNRLKDRLKHVRYSMAEGKMTIDEGFNFILNKTNDELLTDFIKSLKPKLKLAQSTIDKHKMNLNALEGLFERLGYKDLQGLTFVHLNSLDNVKEITRIIKEEGGYKQNTVAGYLKTLDKMTDLNKSPMLKPFSVNKLIPTEIAGDNTAVFFAEIMEGLNNVRTLHQFTAFLWWLYSLCLMGMDGKDIALLSEDHLCEPVNPDLDLEDYFPTAGAHYKNHFVNRTHVKVKRSKTDVKFTMMVNLFPTLMIRDILYRLIKATQPEIAYEGEDRLRLFNFDVNTNVGATKWLDIRKSWSDAQRKCFGFTTQQARHTITKVGQDLGASQADLNAQLGHKEQSVMRHYLSEDQTRLDVLQTHILEEYGILEILKIVFEDFNNRTELINNDEVPFISKQDQCQVINISDEKAFANKTNEELSELAINGDFSKFNHGLKEVTLSDSAKIAKVILREITIKSTILTPFSRADEWAFERLYRKEKERRWEKVKGKRIQVLPDFNQLSSELQDLIKKRFKTINPEGNFDAIELSEKYL